MPLAQTQYSEVQREPNMERPEGWQFKLRAPARFTWKLLGSLPVSETGVTHDIPQIIGESASAFATVRELQLPRPDVLSGK